MSIDPGDEVFDLDERIPSRSLTDMRAAYSVDHGLFSQAELERLRFARWQAEGHREDAERIELPEYAGTGDTNNV